jgi:hypothetical protein
MLETSSSGLHRRPRPRAVAWLRPGARPPFPTRRTAPSPTIWVPLTGIRSFRRLRLLRSLSPSTRPYDRRTVARHPTAVALLGFAPPEPCSDRVSRPVDLAGVVASAAGWRLRRRAVLTARRQGKPLRPHGRDGLVGAPSLRSDRSTRVPPLGDISSSLDLGARNRDRERVVLGGSDDSYQRPVSVRRECSPGVSRLVAGLAASRAPPTLASAPCGAFAGGVSASSPRTRPSYGSVATR